MRVPDEILQCVVFIGLPTVTSDGQEAMRPIGTAFLVSYPSETIDNWNYVHLVTARHVAKGTEPGRFRIRANTGDGQAVFVNSGDAFNWWYHPTDETVDVAVYPWLPEAPIAYKHVSTRSFLTDEIIRERSVGPGDEVFITGLFTRLVGPSRNLPIVRMGNIAMMPSEPVPTKLGLIDAYLIEARSIGGLSGSPAFVRETTRLGGIGAFHLMGLMHGHWDVPVEMVNDKAGDIEDQAASQAVNLGIAIVVPAKKIMEVLNRTELVEMRAKADEEHRKTLEPTFDEASATQLSEKTKTKSIDD